MRRLTRRGGPWLACALLAVLGAFHAVVSPLRPLQRLEWLADDLRTRALLPQDVRPHPDIVIVDIDEASLQALGRWPWPRQRIAALGRELLERQRVAALGFDLVFAEPDDGHLGHWLQGLGPDDPLRAALSRWQGRLDGDTPLAAALAGQRAVLGWYLSADRGGSRIGQLPRAAASVPDGAPTPGLAHWSGYGANLPRLTEATPRQGFFNALVDEDGVVRSVAALARLDDALYEPLALALWRCAVGDPELTPEWRGGPAGRQLAALRYAAAAGERRLLVDEHGALRVPFRGPGGPAGGSFRYVSAAQLLQGRLPAATLAGQLVLLGSSAPGIADLRATPVHPAMPGVEVHAHLLAGLLDDRLPQRPSWAGGHEAVLIAGVLLLTTLLALALPVPAAMAAMVALLVAVTAGTLWAQARAGLVLPLASALLLGGLQFVLAMSANQVREWRRRRSVEALFSSYLPPARVRQLVRQSGAAVTAENRELSVMFCDLQGFSGLAERLPPLALRDLLNRFFSESSTIVHAHGGTLDKFIGDAVMAFWGAPLPQADHAARAVRAALALADDLAPMNEHLATQGLPPVRYGIGLATGLVCVGDLGSQLRRSYTAVGDAVNLAARLEALTRETGVGLLVADSTREAAKTLLPDVLWLEVDECQVRGRVQPVTIFTPMLPAQAQRAPIEAQLHIWHLALAAARKHHAGLAREHLARLTELAALHPHAPLPGLVRLTDRLRERLATAAP